MLLFVLVFFFCEWLNNIFFMDFINFFCLFMCFYFVDIMNGFISNYMVLFWYKKIIVLEFYDFIIERGLYRFCSWKEDD